MDDKTFNETIDLYIEDHWGEIVDDIARMVEVPSFEELDEKVNYYLSHEKERCEIAKNGYEYVRTHHTYPIRLSQMLSLAFASLLQG